MLKVILSTNVLMQLLEFSVEDGWGPLCNFLEMPVPDVPFPRINSREEVQQAVVR